MNIAIAGYGLEGKAAYEYYRQQGAGITILDERDAIDIVPTDARVVLGEAAFRDLAAYDVVIRTPSIAPVRLAGARKIWSVTNEFFMQCKAPIIGVTGTKGKTTTVSLIQAILQAAGKRSLLVGNIGVPSIRCLDAANASDVVVYELSSFQLWDIERSPHIAVVLTVEADHLNVHSGMDDYIAAKTNIAKFQTENDIVVYHPTNQTSAAIAHGSVAGTAVRYMTQEAAYVHDDVVMIGDSVVCRVDEIRLLGRHNVENVCAAISACWYVTQDLAAISRAVREFTGLAHHLELVATKRAVKFYNDSYSSAPTATIAALRAFTAPIVLVVGGVDRGLDVTPLVDEIIAKGEQLRHSVIVGEIRTRLAEAMSRAGYDRFTVCNERSMEGVVAAAVEYSQDGDVVLLSPGCPSFDMFDNFNDRGRQFKDAVEALGE